MHGLATHFDAPFANLVGVLLGFRPVQRCTELSAMYVRMPAVPSRPTAYTNSQMAQRPDLQKTHGGHRAIGSSKPW